MDTTEQTRNFIGFIKLIEVMRQTQKDYFAARKRHDETSAQKYLRQSFELENRVDKACPKLKELIACGFQPELFK